MTTQVIVALPKHSHKRIKIITQDLQRDENGGHKRWVDVFEQIVERGHLGASDLYVYEGRRLAIQEIE